jgi:hypothetical protein
VPVPIPAPPAGTDGTGPAVHAYTATLLAEVERAMRAEDVDLTGDPLAPLLVYSRVACATRSSVMDHDLNEGLRARVILDALRDAGARWPVPGHFTTQRRGTPEPAAEASD